VFQLAPEFLELVEEFHCSWSKCSQKLYMNSVTLSSKKIHYRHSDRCNLHVVQGAVKILLLALTNVSCH
jgi:hypothetical protein